MLDSETELALADGISLFNEGRFFEAHEVWENAWRVEVGEVKARLQGLIKIAAGFYKAERGVAAGAVKLLSAGILQLSPFRAGGWAGVDLDAFLRSVEACLAHATRWASGTSPEFDFTLVPKILRSSSGSG